MLDEFIGPLVKVVEVDRIGGGPIIRFMNPPRLFCPSLSPGLVELPSEEGHHVVSVLRGSIGDEVELFDGKGAVACGALARIRRKTVEVEVGSVERVPFDAPFHITLAVAMPKLHRQGYLIEKCTELGVAAIWPVTCERSVSRPGDGAMEKWSRRAVEACKQSRRAWVPSILPAQGIGEVLRQAGDFDAVAFAQRDAEECWERFLARRKTGTKILVAVGPEGGWTEQELVNAKVSGALLTSLATAILRTETAAIAVCAVACGRLGSRPPIEPHYDEPIERRP